MYPVREARPVDESWCPTVLEHQELPPLLSIFLVEARREHRLLPRRIWCNQKTWEDICDWFIAKYPEGHERVKKMKGELGKVTITAIAFLENPNLGDGMLCTNCAEKV